MDIYSQPLFPTLLSNHFSPSRTRHLRHREDDDNNDTILYLIRRRHEARRRTAMFQFASLTLFHATSPSVHPLSLATSCPRWISLKVPQQKILTISDNLATLKRHRSRWFVCIYFSMKPSQPLQNDLFGILLTD